jgi:hypothetical protein
MWDLRWTKWHWDRFFSEYFGLPCRFHSTGAPLLGKGQKIIIIIVIFITGLHKKPQGCGASVASAAGPFTTKKEIGLLFGEMISVYCGSFVTVALSTACIYH